MYLKKKILPEVQNLKENDSKDTQDSGPVALWRQDPAARINGTCKCNSYLKEMILKKHVCTNNHPRKNIAALGLNVKKKH